MKKLLAIAACSGLFATASVHAQVQVYLTGSTAFRANVYRSIRAMYGANQTGQNPADGGGNASGSNVVTWSGTIPAIFSSQTVTIRASYSGSAAGVQALAQNQSLTFYANSTAGDGTTQSSQADIAFSDIFQSTTAFPTPVLTDTNVGVQPFVYVKSSTTPGTITNITIQQLQAFLPNGLLPGSSFTGNSADDATLMYLVGRDSGSGTRITIEHDALFNGGVLLWAPDGGCNWNVSAGFSSGSGITTVLNGGCGPAIGYLGLSDAKNVNSGNNILKYDGQLPFAGVVTSPDFTPIRKGIYSCWSYEHMFRRASAPSNIATFYNSLANEINNDLATSTTAIQVNSMQVSRPSDGGPITPN